MTVGEVVVSATNLAKRIQLIGHNENFDDLHFAQRIRTRWHVATRRNDSRTTRAKPAQKLSCQSGATTRYTDQVKRTQDLPWRAEQSDVLLGKATGVVAYTLPTTMPTGRTALTHCSLRKPCHPVQVAYICCGDARAAGNTSSTA